MLTGYAFNTFRMCSSLCNLLGSLLYNTPSLSYLPANPAVYLAFAISDTLRLPLKD